MAPAETHTITESLEQFITEKESVAARELELLSNLKSALNRLGYDLVPLEPDAVVPIERKPVPDPMRPGRRRGRPRKKPLIETENHEALTTPSQATDICSPTDNAEPLSDGSETI